MRQNKGGNMKFIGITGGVGAGKSELLRFMEREYSARVVYADQLAHALMEPGTDCYRKIRSAFAGEDIVSQDGALDAEKLAAVIFSDEEKRRKLNGIVHPAVKREALRMAEEERARGRCRYFILEAALLIEEGYDRLCDELWYVDAKQEVRRRRLIKSRGYSDAKIDAIVQSQLSEEDYRRHCSRVIDNSGSLEEAFAQVRAALQEAAPQNGRKK